MVIESTWPVKIFSAQLMDHRSIGGDKKTRTLFGAINQSICCCKTKLVQQRLLLPRLSLKGAASSVLVPIAYTSDFNLDTDSDLHQSHSQTLPEVYVYVLGWWILIS